MKLLLTHRYVWPDTVPYASMLKHVAGALAVNGHEVHVFGSMPSYRTRAEAPRREFENGIHVARCRIFGERAGGPFIRLVNVLIYCSALFFYILRTRPDVVSASTFPPVVAAWTASLAAKICRAQMIYHMQDIHPEVSAFSGRRLGRGVAFRILRGLDNQTLRRASAIVVLSQDMAETVAARGLGPLPIHVINNASLDAGDAAASAPPEFAKPSGVIRAIFAGNLGSFQNLPQLTEGVTQVLEERPELELMFLGDGAAAAGLRAKWGQHRQIRFAPFLPFAQAKGLISDADIGLVALAPDIYRVAYPSKVMTYLDLGLPLLVMVEPASALATTIVSGGLGQVPATQAPSDIASAMRRLLETLDTTEAHARWRLTDGATDRVARSWIQLLEGIDKD